MNPAPGSVSGPRCSACAHGPGARQSELGPGRGAEKGVLKPIVLVSLKSYFSIFQNVHISGRARMHSQSWQGWEGVCDQVTPR